MGISRTTARGPGRIEGLATGDGLSPRLKAEIQRELQRLERVLQMIADVEAERDAIVNADEITALAALSSIFANGREVASFFITELPCKEALT
jgi:transposase